MMKMENQIREYWKDIYETERYKTFDNWIDCLEKMWLISCEQLWFMRLPCFTVLKNNNDLYTEINNNNERMYKYIQDEILGIIETKYEHDNNRKLTYR